MYNVAPLWGGVAIRAIAGSLSLVRLIDSAYRIIIILSFVTPFEVRTTQNILSCSDSVKTLMLLTIEKITRQYRRVKPKLRSRS